MNERNTEDIVNDHFKNDEKYNDILLEKQKSSIPRVDKILKIASKSGMGGGKPEFIITFQKERPDYIIVVECKASVMKHESKNHDKYDEYAVDGVLLYSSYLSKEYDVLAIAVSGETEKELKVSHYLQLKNESKANSVFGDRLLSLENYLNGYKESQEKTIHTVDSIKKYIIELNNNLHKDKVGEDKRLLLLSGILIALDNKAFRSAYREQTEPVELARFLIESIKNQLKGKLDETKIQIITSEFSFIENHAILSQKREVLFTIIKSIEDNIKPFIAKNKYYDVLSELYIAFLRYANKDKAFGIVLTPPHITDLFCHLALVNKNSILLDNCTGTSGFLISGMRIMMNDAKGDKEKETNIKNKQLIGVEQATHIYALACCNMYLHDDGKTNLMQGDCFNKETMAMVSEFQPNIGMLNPPYQSVDGDPSEIKFILNNLEYLQSGGTCVAIIPMERVLSTSGEGLEDKTNLLNNHTLEAVMSMPNELFVDSDVNVVTAILVITAKKPHPANKETYFGYWKDDGFVKKKNQGRIDLDKKWDGIKAEWVNSFINRKNISGFSVNHVVKAKDEWCAEAYMDTDYSKIGKQAVPNPTSMKK
ncbi:MAG: N-6 DNA methylase [Candidatus Methanoperedens sp.]